jgi:hypothetical protein
MSEKERIITAMSVSLSPEALAAQAEALGKNDREYLTHRVKTLLEVNASHPHLSVDDLVKIAGTQACGQGCCCCGGSCCNLPNFDLGEKITQINKK